jgi:hypothetical protein
MNTNAGNLRPASELLPERLVATAATPLRQAIEAQVSADKIIDNAL